MLGDFFFGSLFYKEYIVIFGCITFLCVGILLNLFGYILGKLSSLKIKKEDPSIVDEASLMLPEGKQVTENINRTVRTVSLRSYTYEGGHLRNDYTGKILALAIPGVIFSWLGWIFFTFITNWLSGFGYIPLGAAIAASLVILQIKFWREIRKMSPLLYRRRREIRRNCFSLRPLVRYIKLFSLVYRNRRWLVIFELLFILGISAFLLVLTSGSCLCFYNQSWGLPFVNGNWNYNSELLRKWTFDKVCPQGEICHVYLTVPENSTSSVFVNIHTGTDIQSITVNYGVTDKQSLGEIVSSNVQAKIFQVSGLEKLGERNIFTAFLDGLSPNTLYNIEIDFLQKNMSKQFKTPSDGIEKPIIFAIGGEVGNTDLADQMTTMIGQNMSPDVFVVGGNLAYDNNIRECYYAYDLFIGKFENAFQQLGYIVPILLAVGDHDVGINPMTYKEIANDENGPLYSIYFPQHISSDPGMQVPLINERRSYHYHTFGDSIFYILDSGYIAPIEDQSNWLATTLSNFSTYSKFASYHNPIFSPCFEEDSAQFMALQEWVPFFDNYDFKAVFENREHVLKKSFPLKSNLQSVQGTYYLGDGAWGVQPNHDCSGSGVSNQTGIYDYVQPISHVWILTLDQSKNVIGYNAYDESGQPLISPFSQNITTNVYDL